VAAETAAVVALVALGGRPPFDLPLDARDWGSVEPADAVAAALRWAAIAVAAWLLVTTVVAAVVVAVEARRGRVGVLGRVAHVPPRAIRAPRAVRALVHQAVVGGLAVGIAATPAGAQRGASARSGAAAEVPVVAVVRDGRATDLATLPGVETATTGVATEVSSTGATTTPVPNTVPETTTNNGPSPGPNTGPSPERSVVVGLGEHLWELATREVARATAASRDEVDVADVTAYWVRVCDANRDRLASGDVNVVHIGETVLLPPYD